MRIKSLFIAAAILAGFITGLTACGDGGKKEITRAEDYDQYITSRITQMQQTLFAVQKVTGSEAAELGDLDRFGAQIDSVATNLKELPDYKGNGSYRDAAVRLADFYKRSVNGSYAEIARIYKEVKDTAMADNKVNELIIKLQEEETLADDAFVKEREAFAASNKIPLEGAPVK
ncbi:LIC11966 family surface protein [Niabella hirudinis]|uniref:LIC11966 family surface protein n=1 Tax=Niabella hirudinis TaxID=1285929 RepID=UPI003EBBC1A7